jgi:hypothetical protein
MANGKAPKIPGPKMPKAGGMPKMAVPKMPAAPKMPMAGTPNLAGRAMKAPRAPRMGGLRP